MHRIITITGLALGLLASSIGIGGSTGNQGKSPVTLDGPTRCPAIYAPVVCDNGKTYPNQCEADRHHAKNCVPLGV
jgi:hypothetical protein